MLSCIYCEHYTPDKVFTKRGYCEHYKHTVDPDYPCNIGPFGWNSSGGGHLPSPNAEKIEYEHQNWIK